MSYGFVVWWPGMENAECVSTLLEDNKTLSQSRFEKIMQKLKEFLQNVMNGAIALKMKG